MPLVFAANEHSQHEKNYADDLNVVYEFPVMYRKMVTVGETFIYYRGTKGNEPAGYFGVGVIGTVYDSSTEGRLLCEVHDVNFFENTVPLKNPATNEYWEDVGPNRVNMQRGVRLISDERAAPIVRQGIGETADLVAELPSDSSPNQSAPTGDESHGGAYASKDHSEAVFRYSTDVVLEILKNRHPDASVMELPKNNPGFDIQVTGADYKYVEVKGTTSNEVFFWLSEGERRFAELHSETYVIFVVFDIDLSAKTHKIEEHRGPFTADLFDLRAETYRVQKR